MMPRIPYYIILVIAIQFLARKCLSSAAEDSLCSVHDFTCTSGTVKCVSQDQVCDGVDNCEDRSDEHHCHTCGGPNGNWFYCGNNKHDCIAAHWRCDGEQDCDDGSDEMNCGTISTKQNGCSASEFQCNNGMCIPIIWHCDGHHDCIDKSDEDVNKCKGITKTDTENGHVASENGKVGVSHWGLITHDSSICDEDSFTCKSKDCVPKRWVCDGTADCPNGDDEYNCPHSDHSCRNLTLQGEETFLCADGFTCIKLTQMCDDNPDCPDASDEGPTCKTSCLNNGGCQQSCMPSPRNDQGTCFCHSGGYMLSDDQRTCHDVNECKIFGVCSQECENLPGNYMCSCKAGYTDVGGTCKASNNEPAILYYSSRSEIRGIDANTQQSFAVTKKNVNQAIAVAYDSQTERVYWSDVEPIGAIASSKKNGSDVKYFLKGSKVEMVESMAIDYIARNIYFTDSLKKIVGVCSLDAHLKRPETHSGPVCSNILINIDQPREIAVYPPEGLLFYTNWGENPHIGRVGMDGTLSEAIITEDIGWPNGIIVDVVLKRIYWSDAKHGSIETALFDGSDRRIVFKQTVQHPFSLAVFEDTLFWSDWQNQQIHSCNKFNGADHKIVTQQKELHGINIYHSLLEVNHTNPCLNSKCSHLCLLAHGGKDYTCACPSPKKWHLAEDRATCHYHFDTESPVATQLTRDYVYNHAWVTSEKGKAISVDKTSDIARSLVAPDNGAASPKPNALIDDKQSKWPTEAKVILGVAVILVIVIILLLLFIAVKCGLFPCLSDCIWKQPDLLPTGMNFKNPAYGLDSTDSSRSPSRSSTCSNKSSDSNRISKSSLQKLSIPLWQNDNYTRMD